MTKQDPESRRFGAFKLALSVFVSIMMLSCGVTPHEEDPFYDATFTHKPEPTTPGAAIAGQWYDAFNWNGHAYTTFLDFSVDGTGSSLSVTKWRDGGECRIVSMLTWVALGPGSWNVTYSNTRLIAGRGRFADKPFVARLRFLNGRLYDDNRKRTFVSTLDAKAFADKNLAVDRADGFFKLLAAQLKIAAQYGAPHAAGVTHDPALGSTSSAGGVTSLAAIPQDWPEGVHDVQAQIPNTSGEGGTTYRWARVWGINSRSTAQSLIDHGISITVAEYQNRNILRSHPVQAGTTIKVGIEWLPLDQTPPPDF